MNKLEIVGACMACCALGCVVGYYSQRPSAVACTPPLYQHVKEEPVPDKYVVQQEAPMEIKPGPDTRITQSGSTITISAVSPVPKKARPVSGIVLKADGDNCAWIHRSNGQWKADSLINFGQAAFYATYEQAVQQTRERWCGK